MATVTTESLKLGSLALNDLTSFALEDLTYHAAEPKPQFVGNPDSDGEALVQEPHYGPAILEATVRVIPQSTQAAGIAKLGELTNALQECARTEGGSELEWVVSGTETPYIGYALVGELAETPITASGELAGWFIKSPVVKLKLTLRPFLYRPEKTVLSATESGEEPLQTVYFGVGGDVPAEGRAVITDKASQDRRFIDWGLDRVPGPQLTNLIPNPSFETNTTSWGITTPSWTSGTLTRTEAPFEGAAGSYVGRVEAKKDATGTNRTGSITINTAKGSITPGSVYSAAYAMKAEDAPNSGPGWTFRIDWYTVGEAFISSSATLAIPSAGSGTPARRVLAGLTAPASASFAQIVILWESSTSGDIVIFDVDAAILVQSATIVPYFDGSTANAGWTGTAHASTSLRYAPLTLTAASLTTSGFSGEAKTRSGAYSEEKVKRATAVSQPTTMCGTGTITHVGSYRIVGRVYVVSPNVRVRISYRNGEGPLVPLEWQTPPAVENFAQVDLGEVSLDEAQLGSQKSEIRVEVKSTGASAEVDLNYLELIPTMKGSARGRGLANNSPTLLLAYDEFNQTAGNLDAPKALPLGGNWSEATETGAAGFKINATSHVAERTEVSDANLFSGCYAIAGTTKYTTAQVAATVTASKLTPNLWIGVFARYNTSENWLMAVLKEGGSPHQTQRLAVYKRVAGTVTLLGETGGSISSIAPLSVTLTVTSDGMWNATVSGGGSASLEGQDSALASGGALAEGKVGIYDAWTEGTANTRTVDRFAALGAEAAGRVCYSGRKCEIRSDGFLHQDSTGTYYGPTSLYRGADLYLPPEGESGAANRLAIAMRRNDTQVEANPNVTDKQSIEVLARERFLLPR